MLRVLLFDLFGTVFDVSKVDRSDVAEYVRIVKGDKWEPLHMPGRWRVLRAFDDVREAFGRLAPNFDLGTFSNCPMWLQSKLFNDNDNRHKLGIVPLECWQVYKSHPDAFKYAIGHVGRMPCEIMMITANKDFGDIEAATLAGMEWHWIDRANGRTLLDLCDELGV